MTEKSNWIKRKIPVNKLKDFKIKMNGQESCNHGVVVINGIEFGSGSEQLNKGKGIVGFDVSLPAGQSPEVTVHYHPHLATKEVCEVLGIEKRPSYQKGN